MTICKQYTTIYYIEIWPVYERSNCYLQLQIISSYIVQLFQKNICKNNNGTYQPFDAMSLSTKTITKESILQILFLPAKMLAL